MKFSKNLALVILLIALLQTISYSQNKQAVGFNFLADKSKGSSFRAGWGLSYEVRVYKKIYASIEVNFRSYIDSLSFTIPTFVNFSTVAYFTMKQRFITIPLMFKYKSKILNVSIGPTVDFYQGWEEVTHRTDPPNQYVNRISYEFDNKTLWGCKFKLSKNFKVYKKIDLEPSIFYNPIFTNYSLYSGHLNSNRQYYGGSFEIKYVF